MVSDIYFPIPPSHFPSFYPASYPINSYQHPPIRAPNMSTKKRQEHVYDSNRNHVPYYYSETLNGTPTNNTYGFTNAFLNNQNRHTVAYPYNDRNYRKFSPKVQARINASPELTNLFTKANVYQPQAFRPFSVLERSQPMSQTTQRPSSVVPMTETFRPASAFFAKENNDREVPEWKARLQKDIGPKPNFFRDKPLKPICRIPNCNCSVKPAVDPARFSNMGTLPSVSERSLNKMKNLSLPSLKLDELQDFEPKGGAERDDNAGSSKSVSEQHLGYV